MRPALIASALLVVAACEDRELYAFRGQRYAPDLDCLEANAVVEIVEGDPGPRCEGVRCFARSDGEVFVSAACKAVPDYVDASDDVEGSPCALALTAYAEGDAGECPADG